MCIAIEHIRHAGEKHSFHVDSELLNRDTSPKKYLLNHEINGDSFPKLITQGTTASARKQTSMHRSSTMTMSEYADKLLPQILCLEL